MELRPVARREPLSTGVWVAVVCAIAAPAILLVLLPGVLGLQRYVVTGHAMDGTVGRGSLILTEHVPATDLKPGDVISFVPPGQYAAEGTVTRRVARLQPGGITTIADSTHRVDPWRLPTSDPTVSRMVLHVPWIGYPFLGALDRGLWLMLASVPLAAIGLALGADVQRRRRTGQDAVVIPLRGGPGEHDLRARAASHR